MDSIKISGILAILFGIFVMAFPYISGLVYSVIFGFIIALIGFYSLLASFKLFSVNKWGAIGYGIIGILGLILGIMLAFNVQLFAFLISFNIYIVGAILLIGGLSSLIAINHQVNRLYSIGVILLGILTIIIGYLTLFDPIIIAFIIGFISIMRGVTLLIMGDELELI